MTEEKVEYCPSDERLVFLQTANQSINNKGIKIREVVFGYIAINTLFYLGYPLRDHQRNRVELYLVFILKKGVFEWSLAFIEISKFHYCSFVLGPLNFRSLDLAC
jgi:hypothetical protein